MRRLLLVTVFLLVFSGTAFAQNYPWSLELRGYGLGSFPNTETWNELYDGGAIGGGGINLNTLVAFGMGPYVSLEYADTTRNIDNEIDLRFEMVDAALGLQFRLPLAKWFEPGVFGGIMLTSAREVIDDGYFTHEMKSSSVGYEIGLEANFYPFAGTFGGSHGPGIFVAGMYQARPLDNMGALDGASGFGVRMGVEYRFDFGLAAVQPVPTQEPPPSMPQTPPPPAPPPPPRPMVPYGPPPSLTVIVVPPPDDDDEWASPAGPKGR